MSVVASISRQTIQAELEKCEEYRKKFGWKISEIDTSNQLFTVEMSSLIDNEIYIIEVNFDNYPEIPLLLEFVDPKNGEKGTKRAYPNGNDSFFHGFPCICNPCSRKSYKQFDQNAPHGDWEMIGWRENPKVGSLTDLPSILNAIQLRISKKEIYNGRMA